MTVGVVVENVSDLFSIPLLLQYNPTVINVEEVRHGGFLQAGDQEIAIVQKVDNEHGQALISATRQPNTAGASGTGTIIGIVIKGLAPGAAFRLCSLEVGGCDRSSSDLLRSVTLAFCLKYGVRCRAPKCRNRRRDCHQMQL